MLERTRGVMGESSAIQIDVLGGRGALRLRSWMPEHTTGERAVMLDGRELPSQVGSTASGQARVLCLGPADWLIVANAPDIAHLREHIEREARHQGLAVVDQTHALATLRVQGRMARELLAKGCGLDLHPRSFAEGRCTRTRLAQLPVVIEYVEATALFELHVARSYQTYLHSWLLDAAIDLEEPRA